MPDQTAERIVRILRDEVFTVVGPPQKLHSDQGCNFETPLTTTAFPSGFPHSQTDQLPPSLEDSATTVLVDWSRRESHREINLWWYVWWFYA